MTGADIYPASPVDVGSFALVRPFLFAGAVGALTAIYAVELPRAAPEWLALLGIAVGALGGFAAMAGLAGRTTTRALYTAERIGLASAAQNLGRSEKALFRGTQLAASAAALLAGALVSLALAGDAFLAVPLTVIVALAVAGLTTVLLVARPADAGLLAFVPSSALRGLAPRDDGPAAYGIGWRLGERLAAARRAVAAHPRSVPAEARDFLSALDSGGTLRPPLARLARDPVGVARLRAAGMRPVALAAAPFALFAWLVVLVLPPGALPPLPAPSDLLRPMESSPPEPAEPKRDAKDPDQSSGTGAEGGPESGVDGNGSSGEGGQGAESGGGGTGASGDRDGTPVDGAGRSGFGAGGTPAGDDRSGRSDGTGDDRSADAGGAGENVGSKGGEGGDPEGRGPSPGGSEEDAGGAGGGGSGGDPGETGSGNSGAAPSDAAETGASAGEGQAGRRSETRGEDPAERGGGTAGQAGEQTEPGEANAGGAEPGTTESGSGSASGRPDQGAPAGDPGPASSAQRASADGSGNGAAAPADAAAGKRGGEAAGRVLHDDGAAGAPRDAPSPGSGDESGDGAQFRVETAPPDGDKLSIGSRPQLFAEPGAAPSTVEDTLGDPRQSAVPEGPSKPPRQRLPAWIADLYE